jgi:hypothetical protein
LRKIPEARKCYRRRGETDAWEVESGEWGGKKEEHAFTASSFSSVSEAAAKRAV